MTTLEDEVGRLRDRIHKLADHAQGIDNQLLEHKLVLGQLEVRVTNHATTMATNEALLGAVTTLTLKIEHLADVVEPIKKAVYWTASLIVGATILTLITMAMRGVK